MPFINILKVLVPIKKTYALKQKTLSKRMDMMITIDTLLRVMNLMKRKILVRRLAS